MEERLGHATCGGHGKITTNHLRNTKEVNTITRFPLKKQLFSWSTDRYGKNTLRRPEQKSAECMRDLVFEICKAEVLVLDTCSGKLATKNTCLLLPGHRRFVRYENESCMFSGCAAVSGGSIRETGLELELPHS